MRGDAEDEGQLDDRTFSVRHENRDIGANLGRFLPFPCLFKINVHLCRWKFWYVASDTVKRAKERLKLSRNVFAEKRLLTDWAYTSGNAANDDLNLTA